MVRRGWELTTKSWGLVRQDARLLVFPSVSTVLGLAGGLGFFVLSSGHSWWVYLALLAGFFLPATVVGTYFGVAFVALGRRALDGQEASLREGFRCANERLPAILAWSLLAGGVGILLQALREVRGGWIATRIAGILLGLAWAAATFFVLPVIALENQGPVAAVRRSAALVRRRWGEGVVGVVSLGGAFALAMLPGFVLAGVGVAVGVTPVGIALFATGATVVAALLAVTNTAMAMFQLVLYRYAATGATAGTFTAADLEEAFKEGSVSRLRRWFRNG